MSPTFLAASGESFPYRLATQGEMLRWIRKATSSTDRSVAHHPFHSAMPCSA
ncbi:hypothetical protein DFAR_1690002 [Desulfarculales bacterium]